MTSRFTTLAAGGGAIALAGILACGDPLPPRDRDPRVCPQTYEFGNYGCFRVTGRVAPADTTAPGAATWIWLEFVDTARARGISVTGRNPGSDGAFTIEATRYTPSGFPTTDPDTHTVRVIAQLRHQPVLAEPPRVLAADTAIRYVRLAPVGQLAPTDTVTLDLTRDRP